MLNYPPHNRGRNESLDFISGMLILHMIYLHILQFSGIDRTGNVYSMTRYLFFFMPWFFFKSGMYYKDYDVKNLFVKDCLKLLKPFLLFTLLGIFVDAFIRILTGDFSLRWLLLSNPSSLVTVGSVYGNAALWFLVDLFLVKQLYNAAMHTCKIRNIVSVMFVIVSPIIAFLFNKYNQTAPFNIGGVVIGLFFYALGDRLRQIQFSNTLFGIALVLYLVFASFGMSRISIFKNVLQDGHYFLFFVNALAGIILINNIIVKTGVTSKALSYVGRHSMIFYVSHWPCLIACKYFLALTDLPVSVCIFIYILAIVIYCSMMNAINNKLKLV